MVALKQFCKGVQLMLDKNEIPSVSSVRTSYSAFFEKVMVLYNLAFFKEEEDHKIENVKKFAIELHEAGRISDYIKEVIEESIADFALLLPGQLKTEGVLDYLNAKISLAISDINAEIGELFH